MLNIKQANIILDHLIANSKPMSYEEIEARNTKMYNEAPEAKKWCMVRKLDNRVTAVIDSVNEPKCALPERFMVIEYNGQKVGDIVE